MYSLPNPGQHQQHPQQHPQHQQHHLQQQHQRQQQLPPPPSQQQGPPQPQSLSRVPSSTSLAQPPPPPPPNHSNNEMVMLNAPPNISCRADGRIWSLEVKQQPIRARMCGFGDKVRKGPKGEGISECCVQSPIPSPGKEKTQSSGAFVLTDIRRIVDQLLPHPASG